jgi:hydrogenase nickel incorporation protein HypB
VCRTCGCGEGEARLTRLDHGGTSLPHEHHDGHEHRGGHDHEDHRHEDRTHTLALEVGVLAKNDALAAANREWLTARRVTAVNLMSSPGAGKTTLLEATIAASTGPVTVIEGDQETLLDAQRIRRAGARAVQVNTGAGCHLDAAMVGRALRSLAPEPDSTVFIENVGNLVCPALFDLGETCKVVVVSVTEGDDKPLKYPHMFAAADLVVVNKTDLLPYVDFDLTNLSRDAHKLNPGVEILPLSARTREGTDRWRSWLQAQ